MGNTTRAPEYLIKTIEAHPLFASACKIIRKLESAGYASFFVGGCIRDAYLQKQSHDIDLVTEARPNEILSLFPHTKSVGKHFGIILVYTDFHPFEVATYREDMPSSNGRHPQGIRFASQKEDAARRDFTIHALYYHPFHRTLTDYHQGLEDLELKVIRCIGNPYDRFQEDYLRILRAFRFHSTLQKENFQLDATILSASIDLSEGLKKISRERIRQELAKMISFPCDQTLQIWLDHPSIWSSLSSFPLVEKGVHLFLEYKTRILPAAIPAPEEESHSERDLYLLTLFLFLCLDISLSQDIPTVAKEFVLSNKEQHYLEELVFWKMYAERAFVLPLAFLKRAFRFPHFYLILDYFSLVSAHLDETHQRHLRICEEIWQEEKEDLFPTLVINGDILQEHFKLSPSPLFQKILFEVENAQLEHRVSCDEDALYYINKYAFPSKIEGKESSGEESTLL